MSGTKVVDFVARIPEQLSLHFYDFSTNCYVFSKFTVLNFKHILQFDPWKFWFFSNEVPGGSTEQGRGKGGRIPAMSGPGGVG